MRAVHAVIGALALVCLSGCAGSFEEARNARIVMGASAPARDQAHCDGLDADHRLYVAAAWVDGSLSGASGAIAGALPSSVPDGWRIGLGASAAAFASLAVYAATAASSASTQWAKDCSGEVR